MALQTPQVSELIGVKLDSKEIPGSACRSDLTPFENKVPRFKQC